MAAAMREGGGSRSPVREGACRCCCSCKMVPGDLLALASWSRPRPMTAPCLDAVEPIADGLKQTQASRLPLQVDMSLDSVEMQCASRRCTLTLSALDRDEQNK